VSWWSPTYEWRGRGVARPARESGDHPGHAWTDQVVYEVHVKGFTASRRRRRARRGTSGPSAASARGGRLPQGPRHHRGRAAAHPREARSTAGTGATTTSIGSRPRHSVLGGVPGRARCRWVRSTSSSGWSTSCTKTTSRSSSTWSTTTPARGACGASKHVLRGPRGTDSATRVSPTTSTATRWRVSILSAGLDNELVLRCSRREPDLLGRQHRRRQPVRANHDANGPPDRDGLAALHGRGAARRRLPVRPRRVLGEPTASYQYWTTPDADHLLNEIADDPVLQAVPHADHRRAVDDGVRRLHRSSRCLSSDRRRGRLGRVERTLPRLVAPVSQRRRLEAQLHARASSTAAATMTGSSSRPMPWNGRRPYHTVNFDHRARRVHAVRPVVVRAEGERLRPAQPDLLPGRVFVVVRPHVGGVEQPQPELVRRRRRVAQAPDDAQRVRGPDVVARHAR
jgi:hypothetical protein